ncbi:MAG: DUF1858 domain-containing protein [Holophagaceae bacterium]
MAITPETKIGDFLEAHPDQQEALIARVPEFAKLRNPVLRRTVARLATVDQAARIAGIPTAELVRFLRDLAGESQKAPGSDGPAVAEDEARPDWARPDRMRAAFGADALLAAGEHPLARVRRALITAAPGEVLQLLSPFRPEPLLAQFRQEGIPCWCEVEADDRFRTWILKA